MIVTHYQITKNGHLFGEYETLQEAFDRAHGSEKQFLVWKDGDKDGSYWAIGRGDALKRNEYEVTPVRTRVRST